MSPQPQRLAGGLIDRGTALRFTFDHKVYSGCAGDTVASALLANGVRLMGRSFKYHRPRGVFAAGSEEPNALIARGAGARREPNIPATTAELYDGLIAESQNRWPSLRFDALSINDWFSPFLGAGFYYKTFMWPAAFWERVYEPAIRWAAGLGRLDGAPDPDVYDKGFLHCDLLIVGGGPAGLSAALTAGRAGARVILADEDFRFGGRLNAETIGVDGVAGADWAARATAELSSMPNLRLLRRTTVYGAFDHGVYGAVERVTDHLSAPPVGAPRQTLWRIYSRRALLCAGAIERGIAFPNNDRPGVMLAGAVRAFANRWAAAAAPAVVVFANNDDAHRTARDLLAKGVAVRAVVDVRAHAPRGVGYETLAGAQIVGTRGRLGLRQVRVRRADGVETTLNCGALAVSGGWNPTVGLFCHQRGRPVWDDAIAAFAPGGGGPVGLRAAGAARGWFSTHAALTDGAAAARATLGDLGIDAAAPAPTPDAEDAPGAITPFWAVAGARGRAWLDLQNDVTLKDVAIAHREGFRAVEHLKRYTTLGMATDQGKTSTLGGLAAMAALNDQSIAEVGTTIYRPPYTPVAIGAFAGRSRDEQFRPVRKTPSHQWAAEQGAIFVEVGDWLRAQWFARDGETHWRRSVDREALAVRRSVGVCDVTTLGKIDVQGPDAAPFLTRIYCNGFMTLAVGKTRYGLMMREDGMALDDGTVARLADDHFIVTTTTANAVRVYQHMEFVRQCLCPQMDVQMISTTEAWAQYAVAGPNARALLAKIVDPAHDLSNDAFPHMACGEITICGGLRARLFRVSFSGELAYEIAVPTRYGDGLMRALMAAGAAFDVTAYGTEALSVLRIEKGHAAGNELDGRIAPIHLGLDRLVSRKKDSIGGVLTHRAGIADPDGVRMIGLRALDADRPLRGGAHLTALEVDAIAAHDEGWISSACYSPHVESHIALGFLKRGDARLGERIAVVDPLEDAAPMTAVVVSPHFVDPDGARLRV